MAFDLLRGNVDRSRTAVAALLAEHGVDPSTAEALAAGWVQRRDFLLRPPTERSVDVVVGNPPYIRLEAVPRERSEAYRRACSTMGGRADVYVGFYEHGLFALRDGGALGFICADRWMRNAYGALLRDMVSTGWSVEELILMTGVDAFEQEVDAYPAITVIRRHEQEQGPLVVEGTECFGEEDAREVVKLAAKKDIDSVHTAGYRAARLQAWFRGRAGWPTGSPDRLALIADLEARFPTLEDPDTGTVSGLVSRPGRTECSSCAMPMSSSRSGCCPWQCPGTLHRGASSGPGGTWSIRGMPTAWWTSISGRASPHT